MPNAMEVAAEAAAHCAHCDRELRAGSPDLPLAHGVCEDCSEEQGYFEVLYLHEADVALVDELPFGVVRLDRDGRILAYNRGEQSISGLEPESVLGRNFFEDVAPCTKVDEFRGEFDALQSPQKGNRADFEFLFRFPDRSALVYITMILDRSSQITTLLVRRLGLRREAAGR